MDGTMSNTKFYVLDQNFQTLMFLDDYESMLWVERYNECGDFELYTPPTQDLIDFVKVDNYLWSSDSDDLMIIESVTIQGNIEGGPRLIATGRTLESILQRRILLLKTYISGYIENACLQLLNWAFINPRDNHNVSAPDRRVSNFVFQRSGDSTISSIQVDYEYEKGTDLLEVIQDMCQNAGVGFTIRKNESNQFVFKLVNGVDRSYSQEKNSWVVFSPEFCNLITSKAKQDTSQMKNFIYTEGEVYQEQAPMEITTGTVTGLLRREYYNSASHITHQVDDDTVLTDAQYRQLLVQDSNNVYREHKMEKTVEGEVEPSINFIYGKDYFMGDIVQLTNDFGFNEKVRVSEFIISHSTSGLEMYPTFSAVEEEE